MRCREAVDWKCVTVRLPAVRCCWCKPSASKVAWPLLPLLRELLAAHYRVLLTFTVTELLSAQCDARQQVFNDRITLLSDDPVVNEAGVI